MAEAGWQLRTASGVKTDLPFSFCYFTDDRREKDLLAVLSQFPDQSRCGAVAVIFRHDHLPATARESLGTEAMRIIHDKGHFFLAARMRLAGADGCHGADGMGIVSVSYHSKADLLHPAKTKADLGFLSPIFPTKSHPEAPALGPARAAKLARVSKTPVFALGGVDQSNWRRLLDLPFSGIGAIGAISD